jgi:hypothetical protein
VPILVGGVVMVTVPNMMISTPQELCNLGPLDFIFTGAGSFYVQLPSPRRCQVLEPDAYFCYGGKF